MRIKHLTIRWLAIATAISLSMFGSRISLATSIDLGIDEVIYTNSDDGDAEYEILEIILNNKGELEAIYKRNNRKTVEFFIFNVDLRTKVINGLKADKPPYLNESEYTEYILANRNRVLGQTDSAVMPKIGEVYLDYGNPEGAWCNFHLKPTLLIKGPLNTSRYFLFEHVGDRSLYRSAIECEGLHDLEPNVSAHPFGKKVVFHKGKLLLFSNSTKIVIIDADQDPEDSAKASPIVAVKWKVVEDMLNDLPPEHRYDPISIIDEFLIGLSNANN